MVAYVQPLRNHGGPLPRPQDKPRVRRRRFMNPLLMHPMQTRVDKQRRRAVAECPMDF